MKHKKALKGPGRKDKKLRKKSITRDAKIKQLVEVFEISLMEDLYR